MSRRYYGDKQMARVSIRRLGFRRNGPRNIYDPLATSQTPVGWTYNLFNAWGQSPASIQRETQRFQRGI